MDERRNSKEYGEGQKEKGQNFRRSIELTHLSIQ
jgi:hypothetical protein